MKVKNMTIGIKSLEESLAQVAQTMKSIQNGHPPKNPIRGTNFVSLEAMRRVLTPKRLELLRMIREKHPNSVYELAVMAHRDIKNIQHDIGLLNRIGLVTLNRRSSTRARTTPSVDYDQLHLCIPFI